MYSSADILLLPSYNEGLPYVIIEALASGLPIISTDVGGIPEVIENGQNGYIIKSGDVNALRRHIIELLKDYNLRKKISISNWEKARNDYSLHKNIRLINRIYDDMAHINENT